MSIEKSDYLIFCGDFVPCKEAIKKSKIATKCLTELKRIFSQANDVYVNLEAPITGSNKVNKKVGPSLKVGGEAITLLKELAITNVTLANNHLCDYGIDGLNDTISHLSSENIDYIGLQVDGATKKNVTFINNKSVAVFNYCEDEFCNIDGRNGCNLIDPISNYRDINPEGSFDYKIVVLHGGTEYCNIPNPSLIEISRYYIDIGVDLVVCHHAHVYSGYETYKGKKIYYGTGNFIFNSNNFKGDWNEGYFVKVMEGQGGLTSEIVPYLQCLDNELITILNDEKSISEFNEKIEKINSVINSEKEYNDFWMNYIEKNKVNYLSASLSMGRIERGIFRKFGIRLKRFDENRKLMRLYNYISCQSHRTNLTRILEVKTNISKK